MPVPILGTTKILYKRKLGLFAMYVCTSSVRTYIAKTLKRTIYAILYAPKVVVDILSTTIQVWPSCHGDNLALVALDNLSSATASLNETLKFWNRSGQNVHVFYCITFSEVHMLWSNLCNQVVKLTTWSCTTEVRGRCEKINGQILSVDFLEYRAVHLPPLCTHQPPYART